jgi:hypothetical protein
LPCRMSVVCRPRPRPRCCLFFSSIRPFDAPTQPLLPTKKRNPSDR